MIDEAAFIRTIGQHPLDDAPRLVFADFLDEQGRHPQAEYLRLVAKIAAALQKNVHSKADRRRLLQLTQGLDRGWRLAVGRRYTLRMRWSKLHVPSDSQRSFLNSLRSSFFMEIGRLYQWTPPTSHVGLLENWLAMLSLCGKARSFIPEGRDIEEYIDMRPSDREMHAPTLRLQRVLEALERSRVPDATLFDGPAGE